MAIVVALNSWQPYVRDYLLTAISRLVGPVPQPIVRAPAVPDLRDAQLEGVYSGCSPGTRIRVSRAAMQLNCDLMDTSGEVKAHMKLTVEGNESTLKTDVSHLSVGFFRSEPEGDPCMMLGLNAFRKDSGTEGHEVRSTS